MFSRLNSSLCSYLRGFICAVGLVVALIAALALTGPPAGAQAPAAQSSTTQPGVTQPAGTKPVNKSLAHLTGFNVVELRRYTTTDGERDNFARYFENYFPDAFQQQGAIIFGQGSEEGKANAFTWLRGFHSTDDRAKLSAAFYYGPLWKERSETMNSRLVDHTNVLLLKPLRPERAVTVLPVVDPVREAAGAQGSLLLQIFTVKTGSVDALAAQVEPAFARYRGAGLREAGVLVTLDAVNNFPQLPYRTDGPYLVWLGIAKDAQAVERFRTIAQQTANTLLDGGMLRSAPETVVLRPTARSRLRWLAE